LEVYRGAEVRPIGAFISVIYGTLLALLGAIMIYCSWRMSVSVLAGILCLIVGVGVNVFGTCHDSYNVIFDIIISIIAVCLGVAIASIFILAPTNDTFFSGFIIAMGIAGLFVGAIPFGTGLSRMDDEDTMGIVATLSCLVVFAVLIYKIIAACSAT
ncbi:MAG: hypothetical protein IKC64_02435, partial [Clostridia bacterium]|nr:hypothetical protein [Clostridia bacterium]